METRIIKTCDGWKELHFRDGAAVHASDLGDLPYQFELLEVPRIPPEMIEELNRIMEQAYLMTLPQRPSIQGPYIRHLPID